MAGGLRIHFMRRLLRTTLPLVLYRLALLAVTARAALPPDHAQRMTHGLEVFQAEVRGVLVDRCLKCHGGEKTQGGLNLATRELLLQGGSDGPVIVPFDAAASRLVDLIAHRRDPHMPSKLDPLPPAVVVRIAEWIDSGAPYDRPLLAAAASPARDRSRLTAKDREAWAFQPLRAPAPPAVRSVSQVRTPVDRFVLSRLEGKGLELNSEAERRTLLRRASLDLIGLPPTPEELDRFLDDASPDAWGRAVDRLLESPHHGERWARHWLDVARFAESSGFEHDYDRPGAYHFRDFVIRALNADMPYDQFVRWQLAGDEYEPGNPEALMATGFLGAGVFPTQITANEVERVRYDAMDDMVSTTGTAMLGLTVGCARCHDHKFDPIPSQDYYRMLANFTTTVRSVVDLDLDPEGNRLRQETHAAQRRILKARLDALESGPMKAAFTRWLDSGADLPAQPVWQLLTGVEARSRNGATLDLQSDGSVFASGSNPDEDQYTITGQAGTTRVASVRLEAQADARLPKGGPGRADNGNFGLSRIRVFAASMRGGPSRELHLTRPRTTFEQNNGGLSIASSLDDQPHTGWAIDPRFATNHAAVFEVDPPWIADGSTRLEFRLEFEVNTRHAIGRPRVSVSDRTAPPLEGEFLPARVAAIVERLHRGETRASSLSADERRELFDAWKRTQPEWRTPLEALEAADRSAPKPKLTPVLICAEGYPALRMHTQGADFFPETYFLQRGNAELKRGVATPGYLQVLMPESQAGPGGAWAWQPPAGAKFSGRRRALAEWMTDPRHGAGRLLARVIVNRLWQHHFGQGLVATPNDFGVQGARPSHPELLDWLASELIRGGWRLKPIHRLILDSAVYRQGTHEDARRRGLDPDNALLSRRTPRRLEAEAIRDSLLAVSGGLDRTLYGPGTLDESSRRRSLYFMVKRSQLIPAMQAFDAPEPLVSQGARPTTTIAPQALLLMNSPHVRSWAAAFAGRLESGGAPAPSRESAIDRAYRLALSRMPTPDERQDGLAFVRDAEARHRDAGRENPRELALADYAQVILSLNEFIYVD